MGEAFATILARREFVYSGVGALGTHQLRMRGIPERRRRMFPGIEKGIRRHHGREPARFVDTGTREAAFHHHAKQGEDTSEMKQVARQAKTG